MTMDRLVYQLLFDQACMLQRLRGAHSETDELIRRSIFCAFEVMQERRSALVDSDWKELSHILIELDGVMLDGEFVSSGYALPRGRVDVDLRPFLREIRDKRNGSVA